MPEMCLPLKILAGAGSFVDFEKLMRSTTVEISPVTQNQFKNWCFKNNFTRKDGRYNIQRFSIKGMRNKNQRQPFPFLDLLDQLQRETRSMTVRQKIIYLSEQTNIGNVIQNNEDLKLVFESLVQSSEAYQNRTADFITEYTLQTDTDLYLPLSERVALMTMHAAKGLEFPVVFVCGCENGYIPFMRAAAENPTPEEERRLFYVAMTRAKEKLFLTYAKRRKIYGKKEARTISPFIRDIDNTLKLFEFSFVKNKKNQRQLELF